ncbi:hypothetical protein NIES2101_09510 [Calothrix sp. HK-06]|nr:hypothetical protein NIES2101_09510 [Calothrix sp. HK-06]
MCHHHARPRAGTLSDADYKGERVEIFEAGRGRDIKIRMDTDSFIKIKRGNLRPGTSKLRQWNQFKDFRGAVN